MNNATHPHADIAVVHIVWKPLGLNYFSLFIESYRIHDSGIPHRLYLLYKGFSSETEIGAYEALLKDINHISILVRDFGYDIGTYLEFASNFESEYYFFLNSRSVILARNWLALIYRFSSQDGVGLVGATGSYESLMSDYLYTRATSGSRAWSFREIIARSFLNELRHIYYYPKFPNPHLRTNGFMIRRSIFLSMRFMRIKTRLDTSRFENGRLSITRKIMAKELSILVVGKDGLAYLPEEWIRSRIFWQANQENLLIADNQTDRYARSDLAGKAVLRSRAWGKSSDKYLLSAGSKIL